ncbi:MAG TPA: hypothetical protein VGX03_29740 [Candidatus Binatia bacterium]|jgi:hypothetical protein|nr:hypothetical protein [Candidatus Binatia bacterium]
MLTEQDLKQAVMKALDGLPTDKIAEVLDLVLFIRGRWSKGDVQTAATQEATGLNLRTVPASQLDGLTGLVAWGGDAVADAERLYEESL